MYGYYLVIVACLLLAFLLYREFTRIKKSNLYLRLLASVLAAGSLLWMAYPDVQQKESAAAKQLIIVTDGFIEDSVAAFAKKQAAGIPVYAVNPELKYAGNAPQLIAGWSSFVNRHSADTFHVFGNGLDEASLARLKNHAIVFHVPPAGVAISNIYWKQLLHTGEALKLQGIYENNSAKKIKIALDAFGKERDTLFAAPGTRRPFSLSTTPVHTGRAVYRLVVSSGSDTLQNEPVPVEVQAIAPLQVLVIASSPDFDNTYLKNNLSQQGYQVSISTAVSTNKSDRQFLNAALQHEDALLNTGYLGNFDVIIADQTALQEMGTAALSALRTVVADKGTGLLLKIDEQKSNNAFYARLFPVKTIPQNKEVYRWLMTETEDSGRYKIKMATPLSIVYQPGQQVILKDAQSNIYAAAALFGSGKIVASTLSNTFSMALAGDKTSWQALWSLLLGKVSRKEYPAETWQFNPLFPAQDAPVQMQAAKADSFSANATAGNTFLCLSQNNLLPYLWQGTYWPVQRGWQALPQINTFSGSWYIYGKADWQQTYGYRLTKATKEYAALHPVAADNKAAAVNGFMKNARLWGLFVFLMACTFLWVEQKLG